MMDAYAQGSTIRLCQSYCDQIAGGTLLQHRVRLRQRAAGPGLSRPQQSGRPRTGPASLAMLCCTPRRTTRQPMAASARPTSPECLTTTAFTSLPVFRSFREVPWAMSPGPRIALAQLYRRTRIKKYLDGALWAANFIETTTRDNVNVPPGGYYFGNGQSNKSTEHNIDVYALYTMLAQLTGNPFWLDGAQHALAVRAGDVRRSLWPFLDGHFRSHPHLLSTTVRRTVRPGRTWRCRIRITRSPSTG